MTPNTSTSSKPETRETLSSFTNLDYCQQIDNLSPTPRKLQKGNRWDRIFFENIRNGNSNLTKSKDKCDRWYNFISKNITDLKQEDFKNSILLFEFELMNDAFHQVNSRAFKKLSFLDITQLENRKWSKFDAVLILPEIKHFIFFECKRDSDITLDTKGFPYVNQIYRNMESAYLLTKHPDSLYKDWGFNYVFVCPKIEYDYNHKIYSYVIKDIKNGGIGLYKYKAILYTEYKDKLDWHNPKIQ